MLDWLTPIWDPLACLDPPPKAVRAIDGDKLLRRLAFQMQERIRAANFGEQQSLLKGQGLDFTNLREYQPGDDIRKIDWNVFARTFTPHVREYQEEKQLTVWLVMDLTPSMFFGRNRLKAERVLEWVGLLGLLALRQKHRLGFYCFTGTETHLLQPKPGHAHLQHAMKLLTDCFESGKTRIELRNKPPEDVLPEDVLAEHCQVLSRLVGKRSSLFFCSDFLSHGPSASWERFLGEISRHSQLHTLIFEDPGECEIPAGLGLLEVFDPETGRTAWLDTTDAQSLKAYQGRVEAQRQDLFRLLGTLGRPLRVGTEDDPLQTLFQLFLPMRHRPVPV